MVTFTGDVWIALIANWTDAVNAVDSLATFSVDSTFSGVTGFLLGAARFVRIS